MKTINEYLSNKISISKIKATDKTIKKIVIDELKRLGHDADLNHIDTSKVTNMNSLLTYAHGELVRGEKTSIELNPDISKWNVSNVIDFDRMFQYCYEFNCDLSEWDVSSGKTFHDMFVMSKINFDVSRWNLANATDISEMFEYCNAFEGIGLENWDTSRITSMSSLFSSCKNKNFNPNLSNWDVSSVIYFNYMFEDCSYFTGNGLKNWKPENGKNFTKMFYKCERLDKNNFNMHYWANIVKHYHDDFMFSNTPLEQDFYKEVNRL